MGVYQSCFDLIQQYIYGGATLTTDMELTATIIATIASVFVFALPFIIVYSVIQAIIGRC